MSYVMFYALVTTSGAVVEHVNGRRYWNFMELYKGSDGTEQLCLTLLTVLLVQQLAEPM